MKVVDATPTACAACMRRVCCSLPLMPPLGLGKPARICQQQSAQGQLKLLRRVPKTPQEVIAGESEILCGEMADNLLCTDVIIIMSVICDAMRLQIVNCTGDSKLPAEDESVVISASFIA